MTDQLQEIGDDMMVKVMQYCDGTLSPQDAADVARAIEADPALQALAADFAAGADLAKQTMGVLDKQPVPFALARSIVAPATTPQRGIVREFLHGRLAAAIMGIAVGAAALGMLSSFDRSDDGMRLAGAEAPHDDGFSNEFRGALFAALQAKPALTAHSYVLVDEGNMEGRVSVLRWFDLASGATCAEFNQEEAGQVLAGGVACQSKQGWEIVTVPAKQ
ncbi:hypothetical protein [Dongia sp.]|uniref:hypothetical protein n=1 Tax=Dongia sp. TaxID=1977262 RepID=UPI0035B33D1D